MPSRPIVTTARRFLLWLVICAVSAAPSFMLADQASANEAGMTAAILVFAALYTCVTGTARFARFHRRPFVRETLYVGYGLRLTLSAIGLLAITRQALLEPFGFVMIPDMLGGLFSLRIVSVVLGGASPEDVARTFAGAFAATCVQGAILNAIIFSVMAVAYGLQRAFRKLPPDAQRGFGVVPAAAAVNPSPGLEAAR